jgi:hypothetical protein
VEALSDFTDPDAETLKTLPRDPDAELGSREAFSEEIKARFQDIVGQGLGVGEEDFHREELRGVRWQLADGRFGIIRWCAHWCAPSSLLRLPVG